MNMHVEPTDSDLLLRSVLSLAEAQGLPRGVKIEYRPGEGVPPVPMDVEKLKQVVLNVVRNGIDAMGRRGGTLRVSTRARLPGGDGRVESLRSAAPQWRAEVRLRRGGMGARACVELRIEDEGDGIRPDDAPKLFIPFFTTKAQGTGLGLAISERIMREHGGEIELESSPGEGTRFLLRLPLPDLEPELDEATASGAEAGTGEETREAPGGGAVEQPEQPEQEEDGDTLEDLPPPSPEEEAAVPDDGGPAAPLPHSHRD
jgi:signal transduction histidine kinase